MDDCEEDAVVAASEIDQIQSPLESNFDETTAKEKFACFPEPVTSSSSIGTPVFDNSVYQEPPKLPGCYTFGLTSPPFLTNPGDYEQV